jgi:hypothetical protein
VWTYSFGSKADAPYRQRPPAPMPPIAGTTPLGGPGGNGGPGVDPTLLAAGLLLLLLAAGVRALGSRPATVATA